MRNDARQPAVFDAADRRRAGRPPGAAYESYLPVRLPGPLHDDICRLAAQRKEDVSVYVRRQLAEAVERDKHR